MRRVKKPIVEISLKGRLDRNIINFGKLMFLFLTAIIFNPRSHLDKIKTAFLFCRLFEMFYAKP
jgi:hypothetical protein